MHLKSERGFSLVEVMVALIVVSIGLLGLAKMESLAMMSTTVAGSRSIAALQASSMAAMMHADRDYWGKGLAPPTTFVDTTTHTFSTATACTTNGAPCSIDKMAFYDLQQWGLALAQVLPGYQARIDCTTAGLPVNCTITIAWNEGAVQANSAQTNLASASSVITPTYSLYVEP